MAAVFPTASASFSFKSIFVAPRLSSMCRLCSSSSCDRNSPWLLGGSPLSSLTPKLRSDCCRSFSSSGVKARLAGVKTSVIKEELAVESPVIVVTGASRGIGKAIALSLGKLGCKYKEELSRENMPAETLMLTLFAPGFIAFGMTAKVEAYLLSRDYREVWPARGSYRTCRVPGCPSDSQLYHWTGVHSRRRDGNVDSQAIRQNKPYTQKDGVLLLEYKFSG